MSTPYELPTHLDSTMITTARSCLQKFYTEFCLGLRPIDISIDLHAGACFAAAMERFSREVFTNGLDPSIALGRAYTTFTSEWGDFEIRNPNSPKTPEAMWAAFESYVAQFPPRSDPVQPYFTSDAPSFEFSFAIPLDFPDFPAHPVSGDPFIYTGRFDLLGRLVSYGGIPCVRDEKTAQRLESSWADKWNLRNQFLGYCWALQHLGIPCHTVVVRGVIIRKKEIEIVEAIKQYPQHLIARWFDQLRRDVQRIVNAHQEGYWDYNLADSCTAYGKMCHFADRCASQTPDIWNDSYAVRRWNPLNRNPIGDPSTIPLNFSGQIPSKFAHLQESA